MATLKNRFATVSTILVSAVATTGTFTVAYPSGTSQLDFNAGLAGATHYVIVNGNDRWTAADSKMSLTFGASNITVTNSSNVTWAAGSTIELFIEQADGENVIILTFPVELASITTAQDVVTEFRPGVAGVIEDVCWVQNRPVTTASKLATLNLEIDTTNVTGGTIALTSAACTPMGAVIQGAAITGANTLTRASKLSIEAASVTAFAEGNGSVQIRIRKTQSELI